MKSKYLIPLVLCGLMIATAAPAFAATHDITSASNQRIESQLLNGPSAAWTTNTNYWSNPGVHSGDQITWKDYRVHNAPAEQTQDAVSYSKLNGATNPVVDVITFGEEKFDQITRTATYGGQTLTIWHKYEGSGRQTSTLTIS